MTEWLADLRPWCDKRPHSAQEGLRGVPGPTLCNESDCVMHYTRFLASAGVPWKDMHLNFGANKWMLNEPYAQKPDLVIVDPKRFARAELPVDRGEFMHDAVIEFALVGSNHRSMDEREEKVAKDVIKVKDYIGPPGLVERGCGYVIVVEEYKTGPKEELTPTGVKIRRLRVGEGTPVKCDG